MSRKQNKQQASFNDKLVLYKYFLRQFGKDSLISFAGKLNDEEYEGFDENQNTYFYKYIVMANQGSMKISPDKMRLYDENICRYVRQIGEKRGGIVLKYFQYISLLFTEMYLDRYFSDRAGLVKDLNSFLDEIRSDPRYNIDFSPYHANSMNKLAFLCATGSGKTLIMHINILQFLYYLKRAQRLNNHLQINKIIVLAPNEGMSLQHLEELRLSSISCTLFQKDKLSNSNDEIVVIDMNKLKEEGKVKTISIDSFEQNNLVLVDEGHRGLSGDVWYDYRTRLSAGGFSFEYSATFKQALKSQKAKQADKLTDEYGKSIIMDYSYKFFYEDGYGKDYRIYNLNESIDEEQRHLYLTGCLLSFYQQLKLYEAYGKEYMPYMIEKPLLVFVGNRVTAATSTSELTDVEEVLVFIDKFVNQKDDTIRRINDILNENTGLIDSRGNELFYQDFNALSVLFGGTPYAEDIYQDILRLVFNSDTTSDEPRLHIQNLRQVHGEIGMKIGEYGEYFGVISIGDTTALVKNCEKKGIVVKTEEFVSDSLFRSINSKTSNIKVLIGSRKFTEGWNSWRVSTMGLINFAKGEGSQAIQLFGRGVRLKGYKGCLKRSRKLKNGITPPLYIELLERLTIFGVKAKYMEDFKHYLELEDMVPNENIHEFKLPVVNRFDDVKGSKLKVIKVRSGANFKKQAKRIILDVPDEGFMRYLVKNKITIDCRSRVQTIESDFSMNMTLVPEEHTLDINSLRFIDYNRIYAELQNYKNEKLYYNISIVKDLLLKILETDGWYSLIIPESHIKIDSMVKLEAAGDYCVMVLKCYMDKFYKYKKEEWEAPLLEYQDLSVNDNNFVKDYTITYTEEDVGGLDSDTLESFIEEISETLNQDQGLGSYEKTVFGGRIIAFDFKSHLYAPLICIKANGQKIQISPISLNEGEKGFVDSLKNYTDSNASFLNDKQFFLLRNKSKVGMGFFEAGNFYPDYVLWIDTPDTQYVTFIDPKGLMNVLPDDPKVEFYQKIKGLQERLQPSSNEKNVVLNSFIVSSTPSVKLRTWWNMTQSEREAKNVLCLDNENCIDVMMNKIFR